MEKKFCDKCGALHKGPFVSHVCSSSNSSRCSVLDVYDNREVDSTWLASFCERVSVYEYRRGLVRITWDGGQWIAYSYRPGGIEGSYHRLVEVTYRFEVVNLLRSLKIDA